VTANARQAISSSTAPAGAATEEDDETLAAIDRGIQDAEEGRVVSAEEARRRVQQWLSKSSTPQKR
jgi:predicted transcriptional regulator